MVLITECHNSHKHNQSPLTRLAPEGRRFVTFCQNLWLIFKTPPALKILVHLLHILLVMSRQLQVKQIVLNKFFLKINSSKICAVKSNPINSSLENSAIYKYGELCQLIEHPLKPNAFNSIAIQLRDLLYVAFVNSQLYW